MRRNGDVRDLDGAPDQDLIRSIASGQRQVLAILFRRRQQNIYRFVLHLTGSPAIADDVTQDVFIRVLSDAGRYDAERGSVAAWLCGIARNLVRRRLERDAAFEPLDTDDESETGRVSVSDDPLEDLTTTERLNALRHAVLSLPLRYREAVVACDLQELSYADAALALGCPVGTVRSRLNRGRALLISKMQAERRPQVRTTPLARKCLA